MIKWGQDTCDCLRRVLVSTLSCTSINTYTLLKDLGGRGRFGREYLYLAHQQPCSLMLHPALQGKGAEFILVVLLLLLLKHRSDLSKALWVGCHHPGWLRSVALITSRAMGTVRASLMRGVFTGAGPRHHHYSMYVLHVHCSIPGCICILCQLWRLLSPFYGHQHSLLRPTVGCC
jgi:hypothetical protein